jgi:hypothetical protein
VADDDLVLDGDTVQDEAVALDLAAWADRGAMLDLDEGPICVSSPIVQP